MIAGGMGSRARAHFQEASIRVLTGAPTENPTTLVRKHLGGTLVVGANACDH